MKAFENIINVTLFSFIHHFIPLDEHMFLLDFTFCCLLSEKIKKKNVRKRLQEHLINQHQLQVLLNQILKVAGPLSLAICHKAQMIPQGKKLRCIAT